MPGTIDQKGPSVKRSECQVSGILPKRNIHSNKYVAIIPVSERVVAHWPGTGLGAGLGEGLGPGFGRGLSPPPLAVGPSGRPLYTKLLIRVNNAQDWAGLRTYEGGIGGVNGSCGSSCVCCSSKSLSSLETESHTAVEFGDIITFDIQSTATSSWLRYQVLRYYAAFRSPVYTGLGLMQSLGFRWRCTFIISEVTPCTRHLCSARFGYTSRHVPASHISRLSPSFWASSESFLFCLFDCLSCSFWAIGRDTTVLTTSYFGQHVTNISFSLSNLLCASMT